MTSRLRRSKDLNLKHPRGQRPGANLAEVCVESEKEMNNSFQASRLLAFWIILNIAGSADGQTTSLPRGESDQLAGLSVLIIHATFGEEKVPADEYEFVEPEIPLPEKPWHKHFIDENKRTPEGHPNAGAAWSHFFLRRAFNNTLQKASPQKPWEEWEGFLSLAVWGYLSPDSKHRGDKRLIEMCQVWIDRLLKKSEAQDSFKLGFWGFHDYTIPLLEIEARDSLKEKIGNVRAKKFRSLVVKNIQQSSTPAAYNDLLRRADKYVNIAVHPMAVYVHGWLLTGEQRYLRMAHRIVQLLGRDQLPNGMFPYRYQIYGERHSEYEMMYYHAINIRGLYFYWWATGSKLAERIMHKSIPYYPLNLEPPYHFNGGPDIWWKDQWRTFWPHHIAMVAAVTGDGENARIASSMARNNVSHDRFDLAIGAHAYQLMGLKNIEEKPQRTNFIIEDPDIRGVRLRFGPWSSTFTAGSFTYTRTSALKVSDNGKGFTALHLARPYVRIAPLEKPWKTEPDFGTLPAAGASFAVTRSGRETAIVTHYSPALTSHTWRPKQPIAPWKMTELWLMTDNGMVGLITSTATGEQEARELCHQFRFISSKPVKKAERNWLFGELRFAVWDTDFAFTIEERMRRSAQGQNDRRDWQIALSDVDRTPEDFAQKPPARTWR